MVDREAKSVRSFGFPNNGNYYSQHYLCLMFLGVVSIGSINVRDCYSFRFFIYTIILQVSSRSSRSSNTVNTVTIFYILL